MVYYKAIIFWIKELLKRKKREKIMDILTKSKKHGGPILLVT